MNVLSARPDPGGGTPPDIVTDTGAGRGRGRVLEPRRVAAGRDQLACTVVPGDDAARVELIAELERVKAAAAAAQARLAAAMADDATAQTRSRPAAAVAVRSVMKRAPVRSASSDHSN